MALILLRLKMNLTICVRGGSVYTSNAFYMILAVYLYFILSVLLQQNKPVCVIRAKENLACVKIVKTEFNANLDLLGFPHFITFKECRKVS